MTASKWLAWPRRSAGTDRHLLPDRTNRVGCCGVEKPAGVHTAATGSFAQKLCGGLGDWIRLIHRVRRTARKAAWPIAATRPRRRGAVKLIAALVLRCCVQSKRPADLAFLGRFAREMVCPLTGKLRGRQFCP